jgi:hypothetical protein
MGQYSAIETWIAQLMNDLGHTRDIQMAVPEMLRPYVGINMSALADGMWLSGDITFRDADGGGIYLFDNRI